MRTIDVPGIEGLRGVAALGVVAAHFVISYQDQFGSASVHPLVNDIFRFGVRGVDLFFVLSGFLLALPFLDSIINDHPLPSLRRYAVSRVLRIVPAFWLVLTVLLIVVQANVRRRPGAMVDYLFLQNAVPGHDPVLSVAWTLGIEVQFYLLLPVLMLGLLAFVRGAARSKTDRWLAVVAAYLALVLALPMIRTATDALFTAINGDWWNRVGSQFIVATFPPFAAGIAVAIAYIALGRRPSRWAYALYPVALLLAIAAGSGTEWWRSLGWPTAFLAAVAFGEWSPFRTRVLTWIGLVSYGIYLWHDPIVEKISGAKWWRGPSPFWFALDLMVAFALAMIAAAISYYLLERRAMRLKDRLPRRVGETGKAPLGLVGKTERG